MGLPEDRQNALLRALDKVSSTWGPVPFDRDSPEVKALLASGLVLVHPTLEVLHLRRREHVEEAIQRYLVERSVKALLGHDGFLEFWRPCPPDLDLVDDGSLGCKLVLDEPVLDAESEGPR
jgi:hypothetical protein